MTIALYVHLLLECATSKGFVCGIYLDVGDVLYGRIEWARKTGISETSLRTAINHLKESNHITVKTNKTGSIITVCNYHNSDFIEVEG